MGEDSASRTSSRPLPSRELRQLEQEDAGEDLSDDGRDGFDTRDDFDDQEDGTSRKRKREMPPIVSCTLCKSRKVKCDKQQPSCGWCTKNGLQCEYNERKKPGLRAGYGKELEQRLDRLEAVLMSHSDILRHFHPTNQQNSSISSTHSTPVDFLAKEPVSDAARAQAALFLQKPSSHTSAVPASQFRHRTISAGGHESSRPFELSHPTPGNDNFSPASSNGVTYSIKLLPPQASKTLNIGQGPPKEFTMDGLPPYDLLSDLVHLYFKHINTWMPILHKESTLRALFEGPLDETDRILIHAIVAASLRYSTDPRLDDETRDAYHATSKQKVVLYGIENSSVASLQALTILAIDVIGNTNGPPGWNLLALVTRSVVQLGLCVETSQSLVSSKEPAFPSISTLRAMVLPQPKSWIEEEGRRRLFWCIYLLDRYATIATAFEFTLPESEIDRLLPCSEQLWNNDVEIKTRWFPTSERTDYTINRPENMGPFSYYIEVLGILTKIHHFLKAPVDISRLEDVSGWQAQYMHLERILLEWYDRLPSHLSEMELLGQLNASNPIIPVWLMLHIAYQTAKIRLHSSAAYPTMRSSLFTASFTASRRCLEGVDSISVLSDWAVENNVIPQLGPPFAFSLWVGARLLMVHGHTFAQHLDPRVDRFVNALSMIGKHWLVAKRYGEILQRVLYEYRSSHGRMGLHGELMTPNTVRIIADMRRTAYDLDYLITRAPGFVDPSGISGPIAEQAPDEPEAAVEQEPSQFDYHDVFHFFNLPIPPANDANNVALEPGDELGPPTNRHNIMDFCYDTNSDWLFRG